MITEVFFFLKLPCLGDISGSVYQVPQVLHEFYKFLVIPLQLSDPSKSNSEMLEKYPLNMSLLICHSWCFELESQINRGSSDSKLEWSFDWSHSYLEEKGCLPKTLLPPKHEMKTNHMLCYMEPHNYQDTWNLASLPTMATQTWAKEDCSCSTTDGHASSPSFASSTSRTSHSFSWGQGYSVQICVSRKAVLKYCNTVN